MTDKQKANWGGLTYPLAFANAFPIPFYKDSAMFNFIAARSSTFEQWAANDKNHFAQLYKGKRYRYTTEDMESLWEVIKYQKNRVEKAWLKKRGVS